MSAFESLVTWLEANSTITATLASAASIHPDLLPEQHDGFPALTIEQNADENQFLLSGSANELARGTFRISAWDVDKKAVLDIATTLKSELNGFRGSMGSHTIEHARKVNEFGSPQEATSRLFRQVVDFEIAYY